MYYTTTTSEQELKDLIQEIEGELNSFSLKYNPFSIAGTTEPLDPEMDVQVCRFALSISSDFKVSDRKAAEFVRKIKAAAREVEELNKMNYVIARPPRKSPGR